jgi:tetratricopeptide (TPR) repeat protein
MSRRAQAYELYGRAQRLMFEGQDEKALDLLEEAVQRDPQADLILDVARANESLGKLDRATELALEALALQPGSVGASTLLGDIHLGRARSGEQVEENIKAAVAAYQDAVSGDPEGADATRTLAELYASLGRFDEAKALLEQFAGSRALGQPMTLLLSRIYLRTGNPDKAEPLLAAMVAQHPRSLETVDMLAGLYEAAERYDDAIALYAPLMGPEKPGSALLDRLGLLHLEAGHASQAVELLERARALDPENARGNLALAQAYELAGNVTAATDMCDRVLAADPSNLEAMFHRARLHRKEGDFEAAIQGFDEVVRLGRERERLSDRDTALLSLACAQSGVLNLEIHDYTAAESALSCAVALDGNDRQDLLILMARSQLLAGHPDTARTTTREAQQRFPDSLDLAALSGEILLAQGDSEGALEVLRRMVAGAGGTTEAYLAANDALMRQKRYGEAEALLAEGLRRTPDDDRLLFARGAALERLGRIAQAEKILGRAVTINPKNAMALNYLGFLLADSGHRLADSVALVERALAIDPDNPAYLDSLGWALFKMSRYEAAEEKLRAALRYDRADPEIREHLGDLLSATGRVEEAVREWQAAMKSGHDDPERLRAKLARAQSAAREQP